MGFIANFMRFPAAKVFEDRLAFDKVRAKIKVTRFYGPPCVFCAFIVTVYVCNIFS